MAIQKYRIDTINYTADKYKTEKIPTHDNIVNINFRMDGKVSTDNVAPPTGIYDKHISQLIDTIKIGGGTVNPLELRGRDLYWLLMFFNKNLPTKIDVTETQNKTDEPCSISGILPIGVNAQDIENLRMKVEFKDIAQLGDSHYTDVEASIDGTYKYDTNPLEAMKVVPNEELNNRTKGGKIQIDAEGKLSKLLIISRNNATPYARNNQIDTITLKIEGNEILETEWKEAKQLFSDFTKQTQFDGIGLIVLEDLPIIGNNSFLSFDIGDTATDITVYQIFEPLTTPPGKSEVTPVLEQSKMAQNVILPEKPQYPLGSEGGRLSALAKIGIGSKIRTAKLLK